MKKWKGTGAMRDVRRYLLCIFCVLLLLTVSGCFRTTADELYSLPQASEEYLELQEQINAVLASGAEYSPPTSGPNRQSVQLKDLDGDGTNEVVAFFRSSGDKPLKIYIMKLTAGTYQRVNMIEGDGAAIESIHYADLDGDDVSELVVGWQMSATLLHMAIYSIKDNQHYMLADSDYSKIKINDLDGDGLMDVLVLRLASADIPGEADMYSLRSDGEVVRSTAQLSNGIVSISRILKGSLADGATAIFVEGGFSSTGVVTDILSASSGSLVSISRTKASGVSEETIRDYSIYSTDINSDGVIEVPSPRALESVSENKYYVIDWYSYDSNGDKKLVFTTYNDFADGWYLILRPDWEPHITVRREDTISGERTLVFSYLAADGETVTDFLKIYTLSGDNKDERAKLSGRFNLLEHGDTIYAAEILSEVEGITVSKSIVTSSFKLIYSDWVTGVY